MGWMCWAGFSGARSGPMTDCLRSTPSTAFDRHTSELKLGSHPRATGPVRGLDLRPFSQLKFLRSGIWPQHLQVCVPADQCAASWRPQALLASFARAVPSVRGVMLQFLFYGGIAFMLMKGKVAD